MSHTNLDWQPSVKIRGIDIRMASQSLYSYNVLYCVIILIQCQSLYKYNVLPSTRPFINKNTSMVRHNTSMVRHICWLDTVLSTILNAFLLNAFLLNAHLLKAFLLNAFQLKAFLSTRPTIWEAPLETRMPGSGRGMLTS